MVNFQNLYYALNKELVAALYFSGVVSTGCTGDEWANQGELRKTLYLHVQYTMCGCH